MVSSTMQNIRAHNSGLKSLGTGLVGVFVGGTSGLGETTAREFVRQTVHPRVYLVGRNQDQASRIIDELAKLNPDGKVSFVKTDATLLKSVDEACQQIKEKEDKINLLFLSPGILTLQGRQETPEGLDKKLNLHYYSRMRFITNLLPLLSTAAQASPHLSRVISVLGAGQERRMQMDDLALKNHYSGMACAAHAITMNSLAAEHLAAKYPDTTFIHESPGGVQTGLGKDLGPIAGFGLKAIATLATPWMVPLNESGERHLYMATSPRYPPKNSGSQAEDAEVGADGVRGSGAYTLNSDGKHSQNEKVMKEHRAQGVGKQIWEHTLDVFEKVCGDGEGKY